MWQVICFVWLWRFIQVIRWYLKTRKQALPVLPYSVEEIYGIRTSGRYGTLKQSYHEFYRIYGTDTYEDKVSPEIIITEDSNSGDQILNMYV